MVNRWRARRSHRPRHDHERHCKNHPDGKFEPVWLKCHFSTPGCIRPYRKNREGCVSYFTLRWLPNKEVGRAATTDGYAGRDQQVHQRIWNAVVPAVVPNYQGPWRWGRL